MTKIRVAVVYGGRSSEHGISVVSAGSVISALDPERYEVVPIGIRRDGGWVLTAGDADSMRITGRSVPAVGDGTAVMLPADPTAKGLVAVEPDSGAQRREGPGPRVRGRGVPRAARPLR